MKVKPKKSLGQHFLADDTISQKIVNALSADASKLVEIGPGTGALTKHLIINENVDFSVVEIDNESIEYLSINYPQLKIVSKDFLRLDLSEFGERFSIIGNFPYNISTQIFFKVLDYKDNVEEVVCMLQREVARRIVSPPGSKEYGILSVLLQAWYDIDYLFTVNENVFVPPPKVKSGVIKLRRNQTKKLDCDEKLFRTIVKTSFGQRRKTIRNSLRPFIEGIDDINDLLRMRPEQLGVNEFVFLCKKIEEKR